jgi:hypothetical protein
VAAPPKCSVGQRRTLDTIKSIIQHTSEECLLQNIGVYMGKKSGKIYTKLSKKVISG